MMKEIQATVQLKNGLQARPAALFVQEANRFNSDIRLIKDGKKVSAKSIMGIMSLAVGFGMDVTVTAEGTDADEAVATLDEFLSQEQV